MAKCISVTCDACQRHIENENYQTLSVRRYTGEKHEKVIKIPAYWLCDKCYRRIVTSLIDNEGESKDDER